MFKLLLPATALGLVAFASSAQASVIQTNPAFNWTTLAPIANSTATLTRNNDNTLDVNISTNSLPEGAYTAWWVIFNNPSACVGGCGEDDFSNVAVNASAFYATGGLVGSNGIGNFSAHLVANTVPSDPNQFLFGTGLVNAFQAEITSVIRYHGPVSSDPVIAASQTTTYYGGCPVGVGFQCQDLQGANFAAVPEPSNVFGLATLLGASIFVKRKKK